MGVRVQAEDFDVGTEIGRLTQGRSDIGAIVTFTGTVRGESGGKPIARMTLEHYPGMTEAELERVEGEANARWSLQASLIIHRIGALTPGDNIVLVVTASAHRQAAFAAAEFLMDYLKTSAPFWKKEEAPTAPLLGSTRATAMTLRSSGGNASSLSSSGLSRGSSHQQAPEQAEKWMAGTLGSSPSAGKPSHDTSRFGSVAGFLLGALTPQVPSASNLSLETGARLTDSPHPHEPVWFGLLNTNCDDSLSVT
jgi:molybdopterin synthase catalytic subunit